jgi:hypothetical protein
MRKVTVRYQVATYSGTVEVICDDDDDSEIVYARARGKLSKNAPLPLGYQSFKIISDTQAD